jgi:hypothetical protein
MPDSCRGVDRIPDSRARSRRERRALARSARMRQTGRMQLARRSSLSWAILVGGAVGGALDLAFAVTFAAYRGAAPQRVFRAIAGGLLGNAASTGGDWVALVGIACHFVLSWIWAALFAVAALRLRALASRPLLAGPLFGVVVFLGMRLVVVPLSAYPRPMGFAPLATVLDLLSHMFLFGTPIAYCFSRYASARAAEPLRS